MVSTVPNQQKNGQTFWNRGKQAASTVSGNTVNQRGSTPQNHKPTQQGSAGGLQKSSGAMTSVKPAADSHFTHSKAPSVDRTPGNRVSKEDQSRKPDHPILYQTFFKSVGSRTYAAQVKRATNGNQYLVLTEGRRDKESGQVRKYSVNIFSEDFDAFFNLMRETAKFLKENPLSPEFQAERNNFWHKIKSKQKKSG